MSEELEKKELAEAEAEPVGEAAIEPETEVAAEPEAAAAPEAAPEPEPKEEIYVRPVRQWITLRNGSLDQRVGWGIVEKVGKDAKGFAGLPRVAVLAHARSAREDLVEELRRYLVEVGFTVELVELGDGPESCTLAEAEAFVAKLAKAGATGDDVVVAVGDVYALSVANFVCSSWFGGCTFVQVATDLEAAVVAGSTPYALSVPGAPDSLRRDSFCRMSVTDLSYLELAGDSEPVLMARAHMVAGCILESEHTFAHLFDRAEKVSEGIPSEVCQQLAESVRTRGRTISNASIAVRQSIGYGEIVAAAFKRLVPDAPPSTCFAEALRLSARMGVSDSGFPLDDMLAQDEMLDALGLGELSVDLDPVVLRDTIKDECLRRSNRFMLLIPQSLGRVRIMSIDPDRLLEHCEAWCYAHATE